MKQSGTSTDLYSSD